MSEWYEWMSDERMMNEWWMNEWMNDMKNWAKESHYYWLYKLIDSDQKNEWMNETYYTSIDEFKIDKIRELLKVWNII